jgi:hypothetical protein
LLRNCLLKFVIERKINGRIYVMGRRGRRIKQILDDCKEKTEHCTLKEEAVDSTVCRAHFEGRNGPVVRQTGLNDTELYCSTLHACKLTLH